MLFFYNLTVFLVLRSGATPQSAAFCVFCGPNILDS
jgi:hypothetical protein